MIVVETAFLVLVIFMTGGAVMGLAVGFLAFFRVIFWFIDSIFCGCKIVYNRIWEKYNAGPN